MGADSGRTSRIFLANVSADAFPNVTLAQITSPQGGIGDTQPVISADGMHIAFQSESDLTGHNADGNPEIFLYNVANASMTQITDTPVTNINANPAINADGTRIAFSSGWYYNREIFLYDTVTGTLSQITDTIGGIGGSTPSIDWAGDRIAFLSSANLTGQNPDGNQEIFLYNLHHSALSPALIQITSSKGTIGSILPSINADGTRIAFFSDADLLHIGQPRSAPWEVFLYDSSSSFVNVSHRTCIERGVMHHPRKYHFRVTLHLRAKRGPVRGPLALVLKGLAPGIQLLNGDGLIGDQWVADRPYCLLRLKGNRLAQKEVPVTLKFFSPTGVRPRFTLRVLHVANPV
jgi:hypothetical protein